MIPRRHFLALAAMPVTLATLPDRSCAEATERKRVAARHVDHTALPHALQASPPKRDARRRNRAAAVDPQIARLRAIALDESVEPALIFLPGSE